jgi:hypothetical protein
MMMMLVMMVEKKKKKGKRKKKQVLDNKIQVFQPKEATTTIDLCEI